MNKIEPEYFPRLVSILEALMDVCLDRMEPMILLYLRNAFIYEEPGPKVEFTMKLMEVLKNKLNLLKEKTRGLLPLIFFKTLRLMNITTSVQELAIFNNLLIQLAKDIWKISKEGKKIV